MEKMRKGKLSLATQIIIATIAGVLFGALAGPWSSNLKFIGSMFLRLIQMSVVLLIMSSMAAAVGGTEAKEVGKMSVHTFKWIIIFTVISAFLGVGLGLIIQPGAGITVVEASEISDTVQAASLQDTLVNLIPTNVITSMANGDMVPCMVFAILFGLGAGAYAKQSGNQVIVDVIKGINASIINIIAMVMKLAPIGIFCLLADVAGAIGFKILIPVIKFLGAMFIGDVIMFLLFAPFTAALCKVNVLKMPKKFYKLSMLALTTTSSAICLPVKIEDEVTKFGVSRRVADFTGPITMSMNACGAAMCYVLVILFLSQSTGVTLSAYQFFMAVFLSCLMATGNIGVPGGTVVTFTFLAASMGLPVGGIALLIGIDWFTGMFRTIMNNDIDVLVGMLVSDKLGEFDRDVYNDKKVVEYN
ncbi:dicarboxylate/amino acid:cation symporter [Clostridium sp. AM58-1XD]|uniref:dicarboxylate/amino acid:cation symporter n=1 Tax=Clostridium sp. AM58-1XD TaxID=2292307 RepID=UPI000E4DD6EB|nr:dicarboxylate/amino acid:cation symporter [Clostridium sp. AM58-1XD]RGZ01828.1 dicarboxylate/amino acid:cation symporter [Clostridium sp. AM58-1XD]